MPTNNALSAVLLWLAAGFTALLLAERVSEAESSKQRGEARRVHLSFSGHPLLPSEIRRSAARFDNEPLMPELTHLSSQSLAAR